MKEYYIFFEDRAAAYAAYKTIVLFLRKKVSAKILKKNFELNGSNCILIKPGSKIYERYHFVTTYDRFKKFIDNKSIITFEEAFERILITEDLKE